MFELLNETLFEKHIAEYLAGSKMYNQRTPKDFNIQKGIKEQMNTITNSYNKWLYLFHILVAKITRKTEITKKGVWLCSLFSLVPIYLPSYF